jgi:RAT1-interacting protein
MASSPPPAKRQKRDTALSIAVEPISQFQGASAVIRQPIEITCFSYDKQRNLHHDRSSMVPLDHPKDADSEKYYYPAKLNEELEKGFEKFNKFDDHDEHLDSLLASIQRYEESQGKETKVDVVTWRGMMTKIMTVREPRLQLTLSLDSLFEG